MCEVTWILRKFLCVTLTKGNIRIISEYVQSYDMIKFVPDFEQKIVEPKALNMKIILSKVGNVTRTLF